MTRLYLSALPKETGPLLTSLSESPELEGLTLVGGTALALQINHRVSLDFDFASFTEKIPVRKIESLISRFKTEGKKARLITDPAAISQFKINTGEDLLQYVRDYVVDGIKVTFFVHGKTPSQHQYYAEAEKVKTPGMSFELLGIDGLKTAKILVLADRVRSRDLFDLMVLCRDYKYTIDEAMDIVQSIGHIDDPEHYKAVLTGRIPIDREDEGLETVDVKADIENIYAFFDKAISEYEIEMATQFFT